MEPYQSTTPFGRRPLSLAMVASQAAAKARPPEEATVHKWRVFRQSAPSQGAPRLVRPGARRPERSPDLPSGHGADAGDEIDRVPVEPQLPVRAHGHAPATLRRHWQLLVEAGLVIRRDSPNGKRYARRGRGGLDRTGLRLRPDAACRARGRVRAPRGRGRRRGSSASTSLREEISLHRRDIAKTIATGDRGAPPGPWSESGRRFRQLGGNAAPSAA